MNDKVFSAFNLIENTVDNDYLQRTYLNLVQNKITNFFL